MGCLPKLRFLEFSGEWEEKKLVTIGKFFSGGTPLTTNKEFYNGNISFIKSGEIGKINTEQFISEKGLKNSSAKLVKKGDLLFALYGATSGEVAISKINGAINQAVLNIKTNSDNTFLYNYFLKEKGRIKQTYLQGGQGNLSAKLVKSLKFSFPSMEEQQKIASFLSKVDSKIEKLEKKQELWETYKKGIMQQIFTQKLRFKDENGEDYPDWEEKKLGTFSEKIREKNKDNLVENVFSNSAVNGLILQNDFFDKEIANKNNLSSYYVVENNFFVYNPRISKYAPVGPININKTGITGLVSPLYTVFAIKDKRISIIYLEYYFSNKLWHSYMRSVANYGARYDRMNITDKDFFDMPINLPSLTEQLKIANFLSAIETKFKLVQKELNENKEFKKGLLQQMFC